MNWTSFGILVVAGIVGAYIGLLLSRKRKEKKTSINRDEKKD